MTDGSSQRVVGDFREGCGHARDRPDAADIGKRDEQRRLRFGAAEYAHERRGALGRSSCLA